MISDPQIMAPVVDKAGRSTLTWSGWWTQVQAALNSFLSAFTIGKNNAVTITNPAALVFGGNWTDYTPTVTGSGSMVVTVVSLSSKQYLRVGPFVFFHVHFNAIISGTPSNAIKITLPVASVGPVVLTQGAHAQTGWQVGFGQTDSVINYYQTNLNSYAAGPIEAYLSGFYRCA